MTYAELKTLVLQYSHNNALEELLSTFVTLAQARMSRDLKVTELESLATISVTAGSKYADAPSDAVELLDLQFGDVTLQQTTLTDIGVRNASGASGTPTHYARYAGKLVLAPTPDTSGDIECIYRGRLGVLTEDDDTDFLLTNNPNIYVYATMLEIVPFIKEDTPEAGYHNRWKKYYETEVAGLNDLAEDTRWSGGPLQIIQQGGSTP